MLLHKKLSSRLGQRGAAAVEAAIIFPLLIFLFFGTLEFGLMFRNSHNISTASRSGARVASALPRQTDYHLIASDAVAAALGSVPSDSIDFLVIFKASDNSGHIVDVNPMACTECYRFAWNPGTESWDLVSSGWPATAQSACGHRTDTDYVGVYVEGHYDWATGMFGDGRTLSETTIMRLEPLPLSTACRP